VNVFDGILCPVFPYTCESVLIKRKIILRKRFTVAVAGVDYGVDNEFSGKYNKILVAFHRFVHTKELEKVVYHQLLNTRLINASEPYR